MHTYLKSLNTITGKRPLFSVAHLLVSSRDLLLLWLISRRQRSVTLKKNGCYGGQTLALYHRGAMSPWPLTGDVGVGLLNPG